MVLLSLVLYLLWRPRSSTCGYGAWVFWWRVDEQRPQLIRCTRGLRPTSSQDRLFVGGNTNLLSNLRVSWAFGGACACAAARAGRASPLSFISLSTLACAGVPGAGGISVECLKASALWDSGVSLKNTGLDYLTSSRALTRAFKCRGWRAPSRLTVHVCW